MDRTNAERQRRYIARLKAAAAAGRKGTRGVTNASITTHDAAALEAQIRELEGALDQAREHFARADDKLAELQRAADASSKYLTAQLDPLFDELFRQGLTNAATVSIGTIMACAVKLERALVAAGVIAPSRRTQDSKGYARSVKAKADRENREAWKQVEARARKRRP